jgi:hypothetical protein
MPKEYQVGDRVIYLQHKHTICPKTKKPLYLRPQPKGEFYDYDVIKQWVIKEIHDDEIVIITRRGKERTIDKYDTKLRKATWFEKVWYSILSRWPDQTTH